REVWADLQGNLTELLAKALNEGQLDLPVGIEERDQLLQALQGWGLLDDEYRYRSNLHTALRRGYHHAPGGGRINPPEPGPWLHVKALLPRHAWQRLNSQLVSSAQPATFQPVRGMGQVGPAFVRPTEGVPRRCNAHVTRPARSEGLVTVTYKDPQRGGGAQ